jgi:hypothetical protein
MKNANQTGEAPGLDRGSERVRKPILSLHKPEPPMSADERFEAALWADRDAWDIQRRSLPQDAEMWLKGGGFAGRGRLSRDQAEKFLTLGFETVAKEAAND